MCWGGGVRGVGKVERFEFEGWEVVVVVGVEWGRLKAAQRERRGREVIRPKPLFI